jgi:transposase
MDKVFNADIAAARNILMTATSNNTSMIPVTPEPRKGEGVMAGDPAKG